MGVLHHKCEKNFEEKFLERLNAKVVYCEHQYCIAAFLLPFIFSAPWKHDLPRHVRKYNTKRY